MYKKDDKNILKNRREKGSITLYVLVACIFFTIVLGLTYVKMIYKSQGVEEDLEQIKNNYSQTEQEGNINQDMNVTIQYKDSTLKETWVKEITLVGSAERKEGTVRNIEFYALERYDVESKDIIWIETAEDEKSNLTKEFVVNENGIYRFYVKNDNEEISYSERITVANIDNEKPTPGYITAKEIDPNDNATDFGDYNFGKWTSYNVYIEKFNGSDGESGHKTSTMTILKNSLTVPEWQNIEGPVTLTEIGTYTVTVTTEDNLGNTATSEPYYILIDKNVPTLTLRYQDENGEQYHGEWTNQNLYGSLTINTEDSGKTVQKYQYSQNGYIWNDMIDISGFDYISFLDEMLNTVYKGNENYYFELDEELGIVSNNKNVNNSNAQGYLIFDLTSYPWLNVLVSAKAIISSEEGHDYGYIEITETEEPINFDSNNEYWIKTSGEQTIEDFKLLSGGKKYYFHMGYDKDANTSSGSDTFIIQPLIVPAYFIYFSNYSKQGNNVTFGLTIESQSDELYFRAIYDEETQDYSKKSSPYAIRIDKTAPIVTTELNSVNDKIQVNVKVTETLSGLKQFYLSTDSTQPTEESEWISQTALEFTLDNLEMDTIYYLWVQDEAGNISEVNTFETQANYRIDGNKLTTTLQQALEIASSETTSTIRLLNNYTDKSTVEINKNVKIDLQKYTLTREEEIPINEGIQVEITGQENSKIIATESVKNTIMNKGTLILNNDVQIENTSQTENCTAIYNNNISANIQVNNNVSIKGYYYGIYNYSGTITINSGTVKAEYIASSARGIYNYSDNSIIYINGGEIQGYYGIYNNDNNSIVEMTGGKVVGTNANGIHTIGITKVYGGRIEGKAYGIYSENSNHVTIGKQTDKLTNLNPVIYGEVYGIRMSEETHEFNFYNGTLISKNKETNYNGKLIPRQGYMPYSYLNTDDAYCTSLTEDVETIEMTLNTYETTYENINLTIKYPYITTNTKEFSVDGVNWVQTQDYLLGIVVTENKIIYARTKNAEGEIVEEKQIEITNIIKETTDSTETTSTTTDTTELTTNTTENNTN